MACTGSLPILTGGVFVGTILSWCLLGTLVSQTYNYFLTYTNDSRALKCLVLALFILELLQTIFMTKYTWDMLIGGWGNTNTFGLPWSAVPFAPLVGLISMIVQIFYARRIYVLRVASNYPKVVKAVSTLIVLVAILQCVAAIYGGISFGLARTWGNMVNLTLVVEIWLGGSLACDLIIAGSMIIILARAGRNSPWDRTDAMVKMVNKLMIHAIETGAVTALTALIDLVLFELHKDSSIHQAPAAVLGKLYTNALMVSLNGRIPIRDNTRAPQQGSDLSQLRTLQFYSSRGDTMLTVRENAPEYMEGQRPDALIMVEIPKNTSSTTSEDGGEKLRKTLGSPV